jgi:prephenate dehydrogenase
MVTKIALMGAGGKMGCRITDNMKALPEYEIAYVEVSADGIKRLTERAITNTPQDAALQEADAVILALPDALIGRLTFDIIPKLKAGAMVISLDPAAAYMSRAIRAS